MRVWLSTDRHDQNLTLGASDSLSNSSDWLELSVVGSVPANAEKILVGFILEGGGTAYFANPEFKIISDVSSVSSIDQTTKTYLSRICKLKVEPSCF